MEENKNESLIEQALQIGGRDLLHAVSGKCLSTVDDVCSDTLIMLSCGVLAPYDATSSQYYQRLLKSQSKDRVQNKMKILAAAIF